MGLFDSIGSAFSDFGSHIKRGIDFWGDRANDVGGFLDKITEKPRGFLDKAIMRSTINPIIKPILKGARPLTKFASEILETKNRLINKIPYANDILNGLEYIPIVGDKLKLLKDIEKFLNLINDEKYNEAYKFMLKTGIKRYVFSKIPDFIKDKLIKMDSIEK